MSIFATRYARALADAVSNAKLDPAAVSQQLDDFGAAWNDSPELRQLLESPVFPAAQKLGIVDKLNGQLGMSPLVRNFIAVLIDHDRIGSFAEVAGAYRREMDRRSGIFEVEVVSARDLGDDERRQLEGQVALLAGGKVKASYREDQALLGGVVVTVGSTVYDGSVRGRLDRLKEELMAD